MIQVELYPSWPQYKYSGATNLMINFKRVLDITATPWGETAKGVTSQEVQWVKRGVPGSQMTHHSNASLTVSTT